jgi:hypothetical protein
MTSKKKRITEDVIKEIKEIHFEKQCERDKFKYELCKKHGIDIINFTHLKYKEKIYWNNN